MPEDIPEERILLESVGTSMGISKTSSLDLIVYVDPVKYYELPFKDKDLVAKLIGKINWHYRDMDKHMIETGEPFLDWRESYALGKLKMKIGDIVPREFAYRYAITCHKSQGSEFDKVLVLEESFPFDKKEHARWLYTACTRASEKLVLLR